MTREEKIEKLCNYCKGRRCNDCVLFTGGAHDNFDEMGDFQLNVCCKLIDLARVTEKSVVTLKVKGCCVDDLFHILASNGYSVQLSTTTEPEVYRVDIIVREVDNG